MRPPESSIDTTKTRFTSMPATRAAFGFSPTARIRNPRLERLSRYQTQMVARIAKMKPRCSRKVPTPRRSESVG